MELYLLNEQLERIALLSEYESLSWRTGLMTSTADLKLPLCCFGDVVQASYLERSDLDTILFIHKKKVVDKEGDRACYLSAYDPVELLRRRVLFRTLDVSNVRREELVQRLVNAGLSNVSDLSGRNRLIEHFVLMGNTRAVSEHLNTGVTKQMSWGSIYEHIEGLLSGLPLRFYSSFNARTKRIMPLLYEGRNRSSEVVASMQFGDLFDVEYSLESIARNNLAVVTGQGEGAARLLAHSEWRELKVPYGELWVDANDIGNDDGALTNAQVRMRLEARGIEKLKEQPCEHALTGAISQDRFQYRADYQVGDRIGYEAFGVTHDDVVNEVEELFEGQHSRINITIGTMYPTIRQIIERK